MKFEILKSALDVQLTEYKPPRTIMKLLKSQYSVQDVVA